MSSRVLDQIQRINKGIWKRERKRERAHTHWGRGRGRDRKKKSAIIFLKIYFTYLEGRMIEEKTQKKRDGDTEISCIY